MMNPIRRLPPFFLIGLLPVVILLALWAASLAYPVAWYHCRSPEQRTVITLRNSAIRFNTMTATENIPGALARYGRRGSLAPTGALGSIRPEEQQHASVMGRTWFPDPGSVELSSRSAGISFDGREWILSLWLILLAYLPLWLGISWWQARRRRRRIEAMEPQAGDLGERQVEPRMHTD